MEKNQNFTFYRAYTKEIEFTVTDSDGNAIEPTALEWQLMAWDSSLKRPSGTSLITKSLGAGFQLSGVGKYVAFITETESNLTPAIYYHELKCTYGGKNYLIAFGFATLKDTGIPARI